MLQHEKDRQDSQNAEENTLILLHCYELSTRPGGCCNQLGNAGTAQLGGCGACTMPCSGAMPCGGCSGGLAYSQRQKQPIGPGPKFIGYLLGMATPQDSLRGFCMFTGFTGIWTVKPPTKHYKSTIR